MDAAFQGLRRFFINVKLERTAAAGQPSAKQNVKVLRDVAYQTSKPLAGYVHLGNTINFL
jgi:hypothetical protein